MDFILNVELRPETGHSAKHVRAQGMVPGVIYGQGSAATSLKFSEAELAKLLRSGGASHLIQLVGLDSKPVHALLRKIQRHPVRRSILHVDFYRVQMDQPIEIQVPLHFEGESPAVNSQVFLLHHLDHVEVECLPASIPEHIKVDLTQLTSLDEPLRVSNLKAPNGVTFLTHADDIVVSLSQTRTAEEDDLTGEGVMLQPEVISRRPAEED